MGHAEKSALYNELKAAGVNFDRHYREYTTDELQAAVDRLHTQPGYEPPDQGSTGAAPQSSVPRDTFAAERAYQPDEGEKPIRVDEQGRVWYREEVLKPATPRPRARRKITYIDTGTKTETISNGRYIETVEVAGDQRRTAEVKITMPSYQVGVYKDPRFPFKIHTYNGLRGFDLFDVQKFYGGADLVPTEVLRMYVENDLCYDIRTTIRAIQTEYRQQQLAQMKGM